MKSGERLESGERHEIFSRKERQESGERHESVG